jgi:putative endonuclease
VDFKLLNTSVDVSEIHKLFNSCANFPPIDRKIDILFGAFNGKLLVGATSATSTRYNKKRALWSNFLIVDSDYRRQGIGFGLKQFQRIWAIKHRYTTIVWTLDPFETSLAKFYFHNLGASATAFRMNSENQIDTAAPYSLEVVWRLKDQHVKSLAAHKQMSSPFKLIPFVLEVGENGQPIINQTAFDPELNAACRIEIPLSKTNLDSSVAVEAWQQALKETLSEGFLKKYGVADFEIKNGRCCYVLTAPTPWFLYVVECSDHTLYTGITPDLSRRLKLHNIGRGATYTATRTPVRFIATWKFADRIAAMRAEIAFKRLSRDRKLQHINGGLDFCGVQFLSPRA